MKPSVGLIQLVSVYIIGLNALPLEDTFKTLLVRVSPTPAQSNNFSNDRSTGKPSLSTPHSSSKEPLNNTPLTQWDAKLTLCSLLWR